MPGQSQTPGCPAGRSARGRAGRDARGSGAGRMLVGGLVALALGAAAACTGPTTPEPTTTGGDLAGATVDVVGLWSGPELAAFQTVTAAWEQGTGASVEWEGSEDLTGTLAGRLEAGEAPDVAVLPNPGLLHELAAAGSLVPLDSALDGDRLREDYAPAWIDLGTHDGELYGIFTKVSNKSTVWYSPDAFVAAGYTVPTTWDELIALADEVVADGGAPFSVVAPSGPGSGWALTDWVSQLVLNLCGPDLYDRWVAAEVPWTDPCVRQSFELFLQVVHTDGYVYGGTTAILSTGDAAGLDPLFTDPPGAFMYDMASFAQGFIALRHPDEEPGTGYDFFPFPTVDEQHAGGVSFGGDVVVMLTDTPAARSFVTHLVGAEAQEAWIALGGFTSVNRNVSPDAYPDDVAREVADHLISAEVVRSAAGDLMPAAVQRAWWSAMLRLVMDPAALDEVLTSMTAAAAAVD